VKITLDIKTLITIGTCVAVLGGFYYSTQHRLSSLETQVESISEKLSSQNIEIKQLRKQFRKSNKK